MEPMATKIAADSVALENPKMVALVIVTSSGEQLTGELREVVFAHNLPINFVRSSSSLENSGAVVIHMDEKNISTVSSSLS
mgnify:CR=1 FL=1